MRRRTVKKNRRWRGEYRVLDDGGREQPGVEPLFAQSASPPPAIRSARSLAERVRFDLLIVRRLIDMNGRLSVVLTLPTLLPQPITGMPAGVESALGIFLWPCSTAAHCLCSRNATKSEASSSSSDEEMKKTRTTLERVPVDKPDFAPHPSQLFRQPARCRGYAPGTPNP